MAVMTANMMGNVSYSEPSFSECRLLLIRQRRDWHYRLQLERHVIVQSGIMLPLAWSFYPTLAPSKPGRPIAGHAIIVTP